MKWSEMCEKCGVLKGSILGSLGFLTYDFSDNIEYTL